MKSTLNEIWEEIKVITDSIYTIFTTSLFSLGDTDISISTILYLILAFVILTFLASRSKRILTDKILAKVNMEVGARASIGTITKFSIIVIGTIVIMQSAGIDLSALTLVAGALGVGIGFGLQNITDNFISGIIILFEKPIKVGDRIEVGDIQGNVTSISFRATQVLTNDNISVIVPNSEFISSRVINWSHNDRNIRFRIPVGVSYNEDPEKVKKILMQVADDNPHILKNPPPNVLFDEYADSSINFSLAVWTTTHTDKPRILKSELYFEIFKRFREENVEIPFPQRDIHVKTQPLVVQSGDFSKTSE